MGRRFFALGSISGGMAVALGASGAHVLKGHPSAGASTAYFTDIYSQLSF